MNFFVYSVLPKRQLAVDKLHVSPIHSPYLSSDASTDEEIELPPNNMHAQQFLSNPTVRQLHRYDTESPFIHHFLQDKAHIAPFFIVYNQKL